MAEEKKINNEINDAELEGVNGGAATFALQYGKHSGNPTAATVDTSKKYEIKNTILVSGGSQDNNIDSIPKKNNDIGYV
ncbi:MAG: hypothetical protein K5894_05825 [Lachnospiraceae bacterium]|nr:hypothetical protein [Lachnospiraceae bacterium]